MAGGQDQEFAHRRRAQAPGGVPQARRHQDVVEAQNELAFRKRQLREQGADPAHDSIVEHWRNRLRRLHAAG